MLEWNAGSGWEASYVRMECTTRCLIVMETGMCSAIVRMLRCLIVADIVMYCTHYRMTRVRIRFQGMCALLFGKWSVHVVV